MNLIKNNELIIRVVGDILKANVYPMPDPARLGENTKVDMKDFDNETVVKIYLLFWTGDRTVIEDDRVNENVIIQKIIIQKEEIEN